MKKLFLILTILLITLVSCTKSENDLITNDSNTKIKSLVLEHSKIPSNQKELEMLFITSNSNSKSGIPLTKVYCEGRTYVKNAWISYKITVSNGVYFYEEWISGGSHYHSSYLSGNIEAHNLC